MRKRVKKLSSHVRRKIIGLNEIESNWKKEVRGTENKGKTRLTERKIMTESVI